MALFIFLAWLLPLLIGSIAFGASNDRGMAQVIIALSPVAGITLASGALDDAIVAESARFAALAPACSLAFLFAYLLINVQRRLDRAVKTSAGLLKKPPGPFDYLDRDEPSLSGDGESRADLAPLGP